MLFYASVSSLPTDCKGCNACIITQRSMPPISDMAITAPPAQPQLKLHLATPQTSTRTLRHALRPSVSLASSHLLEVLAVVVSRALLCGRRRSAQMRLYHGDCGDSERMQIASDRSDAGPYALRM